VSAAFGAFDEMHVPFSKYSSHGNTFVLIDERGRTPLDPRRKSALARRAADPHAGVGADSVVFLQPCDETALPACFNARFFEPNGDEFLMSANGLMCVALHLFREHGVADARVVVEIPSGRPRTCAVSYERERGRCTLVYRPDRARVADFVSPSFAARREAGALLFDERTALAGASLSQSRGMVVYTGEPHLVIFEDDGPAAETPLALPWRRLEALGRHFNEDRRADFPFGVNVDVARALGDGSIEYSCFERGLCRETLACGTGALAVSIAARRYGFAHGDRTRMLPRLGRSHARYRNAEIIVEHRPDGDSALFSEAEHVFAGAFGG
jgi:diaminopimelate epimerase